MNDLTTQVLAGPCGKIEVLMEHAPHARQDSFALICHPHPLHGGTMHNKVVYTLARLFRDLNIPSVRFNFRGVGDSEGEYDHGAGETTDCLWLVEWAKQHFACENYYLAGFSFGSFVAQQTALQKTPQALLSIAPPVERYGFTQLTAPACPWIVVQGEQDDVVTPQAVFDWLQQFTDQVELICMPDADHFFHGKLTDLREQLKDKLQAYV